MLRKQSGDSLYLGSSNFENRNGSANYSILPNIFVTSVIISVFLKPARLSHTNREQLYLLCGPVLLRTRSIGKKSLVSVWFLP